MTIETADTADPANLVPVQGYPGQQEHQTCDECDGLLEIKEVIWESASTKRVSLICQRCGDITVSNKEHRMFKQQITVTGEN